MRFAAFDLSLAHTGWAVSKDGLATWGTIESPPLDGDHGDLARLQSIVSQVGEIARGSDLVAVEGFAFTRPNQSHILGALGYFVRMWLWKHDLPFVVIPPSSLKKWATGSGKSKKDVMLREVCRRWNVVIDDDNAADAYALLRLAEALVGDRGDSLTGFQQDVAKAIDKSQKQRYEHLIGL